MEENILEIERLTEYQPSPGWSQTTGTEWEITIIGVRQPTDLVEISGRGYIPSKNGRLYAEEALRLSAPMWEGVKVYDNHLTDEEFKSRQGMRSVSSEWLGTIVNPRYDEQAHRLLGTLKIVDQSLAAKLTNAHQQGILSSVGLSIDTAPLMKSIKINGKDTPVIEGFQKIYSVDLVAEPAAGGGFNRLIASENILEEDTMTEEVKDVIVQDTPITPVVVPTPPVSIVANDQVRRLECRIELGEKLQAAKLPAQIEMVVRKAFEGRVFESADLDGVLNAAKAAQSVSDASGQAQPVAEARVVYDEKDKYEAEFLRLVAGNRTFRSIESNQDNEVQGRIPESYRAWIRNGRPNTGAVYLREWTRNLLGGDPLTDTRAYEALTTSDLTSIVKNAVNLLAAVDYSARSRWWDPIVRVEELDTIDSAVLIRTYGLSTLSVVSEGNAYTEMSWADDEEDPTFVKKGNFVGITLETLMSDKLNKIRRIPELLSTSWYNTISALNAAVFTTNTAAGPQLVDTGALFNSTAVATPGGHANLGSTALSYASYSAARTAMKKQTDQTLGAGRRLLIEPKFLLVPADLEATAKEIQMSELAPGQSAATSGMQLQTANQFKGAFQVIVVPEWTDTNNWSLVADPGQYPAIYNLFLRGNSVPNIYTADSALSGAMFTNDVIRYKVNMMTWRFSATYDCAPVADFRPMYHSIVT